MIRNRKVARGTLKRDESDSNHITNRNRNYDIEEVFPPKSRRNPFKSDKKATDRACYFIPEQKDFSSQLTEVDGTDQYQSLLIQQYGFDPIIPETINQLKELRKVLCTSTPKVDDSSQYISPDEVLQPYIEAVDESRWLNIEDTNDIENIIERCPTRKEKHKSEVKNIRISEVPHIKVIAEKFSTFKKNNVELRKLDEKVVCIEYDIFEGDNTVPVQKMRAYFSIKPQSYNSKYSEITSLPSNVKHEFDIDEADLKNLNDKEIEIIDGKLKENKPYIEDLISVLKRKHAIYSKRNKSNLDLKALYEMAKTNKPALDGNFSDTNLLSKAELDDIKELILKKCSSSMYGMNRKTIKPDTDSKDFNRYTNVNVVSQSIFVELLRNQKS